jgi:hypothetical protein
VASISHLGLFVFNFRSQWMCLAAPVNSQRKFISVYLVKFTSASNLLNHIFMPYRFCHSIQYSKGINGRIIINERYSQNEYV